MNYQNSDKSLIALTNELNKILKECIGIEKKQLQKDKVNRIIEFIFNMNYKSLLDFLKNNFHIDEEKSEYYSKLLLDLYIPNNKNYQNKKINNKNQKIIFWHSQKGKLLFYRFDYPLCYVLKMFNNIVGLYKNKKINNLPLGIVFKDNGNIAIDIEFPPDSCNECINSNIECYLAKVYDKENIFLVFINGNCRFDFWCKYSIRLQKFIEWDFWK